MCIAKEAHSSASGGSGELAIGRPGAATFNESRDSAIAGLSHFEACVEEVRKLEEFSRFARPQDAQRIVLQFVYDFLEASSDLEFATSTFDGAWASFQSELESDSWTYLATCYLENFASNLEHQALVDGISIHHRSNYDFRGMGWSDFQLEKLHENWHGRGMHVVVAEDRIAKSPDNLILMGTGVPEQKIIKMLCALRLTKEGDVGIGQDGPLWSIFNHRRSGSGFPPPSGVSRSSRSTGIQFGQPYTLDPADVPEVAHRYTQLGIIEAYSGKSIFNIDLAIKYFESSYDRVPLRSDACVVDLATSAEALLGTKLESAFRLASRAAGLLGGSDDERKRIFELMRSCYDARSTIVHGSELKPKHAAILEDYREFRSLVRRLISAFLYLIEHPHNRYTKKYFAETDVDIDLQSSRDRTALREAMGLRDAS